MLLCLTLCLVSCPNNDRERLRHSILQRHHFPTGQYTTAATEPHNRSRIFVNLSGPQRSIVFDRFIYTFLVITKQSRLSRQQHLGGWPKDSRCDASGRVGGGRTLALWMMARQSIIDDNLRIASSTFSASANLRLYLSCAAAAIW